MTHPFIDTDQMPIPAPAAGLGTWENVPVPDDGDERKAAILGSGVEALAERTTWLRHRSIIAEPYGVTIPSLTNSGATVGASNSFVVNKRFTLAQSIPTGAGGGAAPTIWVTPSAPFMIEGCYIQFTGSATSSALTALVRLDLLLGSNKLITGTVAFSGGVMPINGTSTNPSIIGIHVADRGPLLDGTLTNSGLDTVSAASAPGVLIAYYDNFNGSFYGKPITLRLTHSSGSSITFNMPLSVAIFGRLL